MELFSCGRTLLLPISPAYPPYSNALNRRGVCLQECIPGRGKTTRMLWDVNPGNNRPVVGKAQGSVSSLA